MPRQYTPTLLRSDTLHGRLLVLVRGQPAGARLPSVRELMQRFAASQVTIDRALDRLKAEGYVEARPGRGLFAAGRARRGTVALLLNEEMSHFELQAMRHAREVLDRAGYAMRLATFRIADGILPALRELACDALLVLPSPSRRVLEELQQARPSATPTVVLDLVPEDFDLNAVGTDNDAGGALAAGHLLGLGHRRLALVLSEPDVASRRERIAGFTRQAARAGDASVEVIDCLGLAQRSPVPVRGGSFGVARFGIAQVLRERGALAASGLFVDSDMGALGTMKALLEAGTALPAAASVIGFDDLPEARCFHPGLTTVGQDQAGWITAALGIIEQRLAGDAGPARRIRVPPALVVRESTAAPRAR